jgi:cell division septation protein DedD
MKAEERKEIEQNSLIHLIQKWRESLAGRGLYYLVGTIALVIAAVLLWNYFSRESRNARDAKFLQLERADTPQKLKDGMNDHRGTLVGSLFKLHLARHLLYNDGLPKLGTDSDTGRRQAASAVEEARNYFRELADEFAGYKEEGLAQQAWVGAAEAEETLVGLPKTPGGSDYQGEADKAIEYYANAGKIMPDAEYSKKQAARADMLRNNKTQFIATQREIYKPVEKPFDFSAKDRTPTGPTPPAPEPAKIKEPDPKAPRKPTPSRPTRRPSNGGRRLRRRRVPAGSGGDFASRAHRPRSQDQGRGDAPRPLPRPQFSGL